MNFLDANSLFQTVDNVSEALFFDLEIGDNKKTEIADFILNQQGKPKTYADTFAPTEIDLKHDLVLFTGEKIKTNAGRCHMIGEESSRILRLIGGQSEKVQRALNKADLGLLTRINSGKNDPRYIHGTYCCKACTCSLWLNTSSGGLKNDISLLDSGLKYLKTHRDNKGSWKGFPSNYILYVLNEIETDLVLDELKYAGNAIERKLKRKISSESKYDLRRIEIYKRILDKINTN
jgi:hypothetical protein